jgi:hypothetical protein
MKGNAALKRNKPTLFPPLQDKLDQNDKIKWVVIRTAKLSSIPFNGQGTALLCLY